MLTSYYFPTVRRSFAEYRTAEGGAIKVRRIRADGALGEVAVIAKTDISRSSGFPRMARLGDESILRGRNSASPHACERRRRMSALINEED